VSDRKTTVGASEIAAVLGADPYRTAQDVWESKVLGKPFQENEHIIRGRCLESGLLDWWEILSERRLRRAEVPQGAFSKDSRQVSLAHPCGWASATLDGLTEDGALVVEAKCPASGKNWNEKTCEHPFQYRLQVIWQIGVAQACGLPVQSGELIAGPLWGRLQRHAVAADAVLFAQALERARQFIECVKAGQPLPASFGGTTGDAL
jgi:putative phage-type endonuclease